MNKYIKYAFTLILSISLFSLNGQNTKTSATGFIQQSGKTKRIKSSKRRAPKWVNGLEKGYIIAVGSGGDINSAKEDVLMRIKEKIIRSVAENVQFESKSTQKEELVNNISNYVEKYESTTKSKSADVSFVKGISLNKAEDFYWETLQNKKTKQIVCYYHVKYPFSEVELKKLVMAFEKIDRELTKQLNGILDNIPTMTSVEGMVGAIKELSQLSDRFMGPRKSQAQTGISRLKTRIKSITIHTESSSVSEIVYSLRIGDQIVTSSKKPKVRCPNKCATITDIEPTKSGWKIKFDAQYCYDDPDNRIEVIHNISYNKLKKAFYFNINENKVEIYLHSDILMNAKSVDNNTANNVSVTFTVASKYDSPLVIDRIVLKYDKVAPISFENINQTVKGKGDHDITLSVDKSLDVEQFSSKVSKLVNGMIYYHSQKDGKNYTYKLYKQTVTTNF